MHDLPTPDPESYAHSEKMRAHITALIGERAGFLSFAEYMQECLYAPGLGYYTAGARKFGDAGDFVTAPELSPIFGRLIGNQVAPLREELATFDVLELGAGTGQLAVSLLERLAELDALPERYQILEVSPDLVQRQQRLLETRLPQLAARVEWLDRIPASFSGLILANEVLDALPVERFAMTGAMTGTGIEPMTGTGIEQLGVGVDASGALVERRRAAPEALIAAVGEVQADLQQSLPAGFVSEVCLAAPSWVGQLTESLQQGLLLFVDYGLDRASYYHEDRDGGWLRCHFRHHAHNDALIYPGIQDLTSWVDFSAIAAAGLAAGAHVAGYVSQAHFLIAAGLDEELADMQTLPERERLQVAGAIRSLMMPGEMGESFKCLGLSKSVTRPPALTQMDRTHTL